MKIWAWGTAVVSTLSLAVVACTSTGGTGGSGNNSTGGQTVSSGTHSTSSSGSMSSSSGAGGSGPCGSLAWDNMNVDCNQCMLDNCCDQLAACDTGTACGALFDCLGKCQSGDKACQDSCTSSQMAGLPDAQALLGCYDSSCKGTQACGVKVCDSGFIVADQGCGDCLTTNCCDSWKACGMDTTCAQCATATTPPAGCDTNTLLQAAHDCRDNKCAMQCATAICDSGLGTQNPACNYCLGQNCCAPIDTCKADPSCLNCLSTSGSASGCSTNTAYQAVTTCWNGNCQSDCGKTGG